MLAGMRNLNRTRVPAKQNRFSLGESNWPAASDLNVITVHLLVGARLAGGASAGATAARHGVQAGRGGEGGKGVMPAQTTTFTT